jgi:predicted ribosome quality control (RQC) complex YloA/Tae2 family protein
VAIDGITLHLLADELRESLTGARVEKVYQPAREEIVFHFRSPSGQRKLLFSAGASSPRIYITQTPIENPQQPPMFCMLLRKHLTGAVLKAMRQDGFERVLMLDFETNNEMGDRRRLTVAAEMTGKFANLVLIDAESTIIDCLKRINYDKSKLRQLLPGLEYTMPPPQQRVSILKGGADVVNAMKNSPKSGRDAAVWLSQTLEGASALLCREMIYLSRANEFPAGEGLSPIEYESLADCIDKLKDIIIKRDIKPTVIVIDGEMKDFCFIDITQYQNAAHRVHFGSICEMLAAYYSGRDDLERKKQRSRQLSRSLAAKIDRLQRKLSAQKNELLECGGREILRTKADLLSANLYRLKKGMENVELENLFDEQQDIIEIKLNPLLTPTQNINRYYKDYRKADTAEKMLVRLIGEGENELTYLFSVADALERAGSFDELAAIKQELAQAGAPHAGRKKAGRSRVAEPKPLEYLSSDKIVILSGRNNMQNERLTFKKSSKDDIWFHVRAMPGSHTIAFTQGRPISDKTLLEAATIAAVNSKAATQSKADVDYTAVKNVRRIPGGRPGMVSYDNFSTITVNVDTKLAQGLATKLE